jgi:hypothetical protein
LPASPARAASIVAFSASRLVCAADCADQIDHVADLLRAIGQRLHDGISTVGILHRAFGDLGRLRHLTRDF